MKRHITKHAITGRWFSTKTGANPIVRHVGDAFGAKAVWIESDPDGPRFKVDFAAISTDEPFDPESTGENYIGTSTLDARATHVFLIDVQPYQ